MDKLKEYFKDPSLSSCFRKVLKGIREDDIWLKEMEKKISDSKKLNQDKCQSSSGNSESNFKKN